jgi:hypothetical protein
MDAPPTPADVAAGSPSVGAALTALAGEIQPLITRSRASQEELARFRAGYKLQPDDAPLPPTTLHEIRKGTRRYLDIQEQLGSLAERAARLAPQAHDAETQRQALTAALAVSVLLYDNYLAMLPLLGDRRFRRLVNHVDLGYGISRNEIWHVVERLNDNHSRRQLVRLVERWEGGRRQGAASPDGLWPHLEGAIAASATYYLAQDRSLDSRLPTPERVWRERILDGLAHIGNEALYLVSEGFGNAIGKVELRKGKLWQREDVLGHLHKVLQPLDLLLEKTPFRLTDLLIPGHFGHVAIWMGRPRKLKRLGVWKQEEMQAERYQNCRPLIEEGRGVLEALRSGVELNPLRVFANVDDLAIIRPRRLGRKERVASLVRGFHQIGKEYDFNFDVETTDTIVCSELPYHVYSSIRWQTEEQLGRFTISPDDVAREALGPNPDFSLMAFYHDGALVPPETAKTKLRSLVSP